MSNYARVLLFSGHMIDRPGRAKARFPADKAFAARRALDRVLEDIHADGSCIAICGGACGGDLLFAEAASRLGCPVWLFLPFARTAFIKASVEICGGDWPRRFEAIERIAQSVRIADAFPGDPQAFAANNMRMLAGARAVRRPGSAFHLVCIWDGLDGDGPGGTADMVRLAVKSGAVVSRIDPYAL